MDGQKKQSALTLDLNQRLLLRTSQWCKLCGTYTRMLTVDEAASISRASTNNLEHQTRAAQIHYRETSDGRRLVCLTSLLQATE